MTRYISYVRVENLCLTAIVNCVKRKARPGWTDRYICLAINANICFQTIMSLSEWSWGMAGWCRNHHGIRSSKKALSLSAESDHRHCSSMALACCCGGAVSECVPCNTNAIRSVQDGKIIGKRVINLLHTLIISRIYVMHTGKQSKEEILIYESRIVNWTV